MITKEDIDSITGISDCMRGIRDEAKKKSEKFREKFHRHLIEINNGREYYIPAQKKENKMRKFFRKIRQNANRVEVMWNVLSRLCFVKEDYRGNPDSPSHIKDWWYHIDELECKVDKLIKNAYTEDFFETCPGNVNFPGLDTFDGAHLKTDMIKFKYIIEIDTGYKIVKKINSAYTTKPNALEHKATLARFKREIVAFNKKKKENK